MGLVALQERTVPMTPDMFDEELGLVVTEHRPDCGGECIEAGCTIEDAE